MEETPGSAPGRPSLRERLPGFAWAALLTLPLWLSLVSFPMAPDTQLDGSWQEVLIYAHAHGWQFGRQVIFTWGPWGFLCSQFHLGAGGAGIKILWETAGKLLMAVALVYLIRALARWRQVAFAAAFVLFHGFFLDLDFFVLIVLAVLAGLMRRDASVKEFCVWVAVLAFLALFKFTYMVIATAGVGAAALAWVQRRNLRVAGGMAAGYLGAVLLGWLAAGQNPDDLYPYVRRSFEVAAGYGDAMGLDESWRVFGWGVAVCAVCLIFCWRMGKSQRDRGFAFCAAGFAALAWLVMWKESFTRADNHVDGFFAYTLILALVLPGLFFRRTRFHWFELTPALCLAGVWSADPSLLIHAPRIACLTLARNAKAVARAGRLPAEWQEACAAAAARADLPEVRRAVGHATVDVYDFKQGAALLNGLHYTPRPVFQSYTAYTPGLEGWNLRFFQSAAAPDFLLWNDVTIDNRYPGIDDASLVAALPLAYEPVLEEHGYWLLKRRAVLPPGRLDRRLLLSRTLRLGEDLELPPVRDHAVWLQASFELNTLGRLRALLYKPPSVDMTVTEESGRQSTWRVLPRVAEDGFLLEPLLESGSDFAALLRGRGRVWINSIRFEAPPDQAEFWKGMAVHIFTLPQLPLQSESLYTNAVAAGIVDSEPLMIRSAASKEEFFQIASGRAVLLHAPGEMVLAVPSGARELAGFYGIRDGAFEGKAHTGGVEFVLEGFWPDGRSRVLWRRRLDPLNQGSDRGAQRLELVLPPDAPSRVALRTLPNLKDDNRWDWSYVSGLRFLPGASR